MGSVGSCFDNAAAEAFFSTLEHEVLSRHHYHQSPRTPGCRGVVPRLLQHPAPAHLSGIDVADPIRDTRYRPTGRSLTKAFTIRGKAHGGPRWNIRRPWLVAGRRRGAGNGPAAGRQRTNRQRRFRATDHRHTDPSYPRCTRRPQIRTAAEAELNRPDRHRTTTPVRDCSCRTDVVARTTDVVAVQPIGEYWCSAAGNGQTI